MSRTQVISRYTFTLEFALSASLVCLWNGIPWFVWAGFLFAAVCSAFALSVLCVTPRKWIIERLRAAAETLENMDY